MRKKTINYIARIVDHDFVLLVIDYVNQVFNHTIGLGDSYESKKSN